MATVDGDAGDSDTDDELPAGWDERVSVDGRVYYASHATKTTQWLHPISGKRKRVAGELPYGWERKVSEDGYISYVDHINNKSTVTDPRLAFAVEDKDDGRTEAAQVAALKQKYDAHTTALNILAGRDLTGSYAIITGANSGVGYETARSLALRGCHVVLACRNEQEASSAVDRIGAERPQARVVSMRVDLAKLKTVREFACQYVATGWPLNLLVLNAAVFSPPYECTEDGLELTFQVNHLGHYYLTRLLEATLLRSAPARVVCVSSESHRFNPFFHGAPSITMETLSPSESSYRGMLAYNLSKLCNVAFSHALNNRLSRHGVCSNAVHPGNMVGTSLSRHWWAYRLIFALARPFTKSLQQAAATVIYAATCRDLDGIGGLYFNNCWISSAAPLATDQGTCEALWQFSESILIAKMGQAAFVADVTTVQ